MRIQRKKVQIQRARKRGHTPPHFNSVFNPSTVDTVSVGESDDPEVAVREELRAVAQSVVDEKRARRDEYRTEVDTEYWFVVCFQNRAQKDEFLQKVGWDRLGDKYLDGLAVAQVLGVDIQPIELRVRRGRRTPKLLREEVLQDETIDS